MSTYMKNAAVLMLFAALAAGSAEAKSPKRGVSESSFSLGCQMEALAPGVSWYYNWGNAPSKGYQNSVEDFTGFEFIPMAWNAGFSEEKIRSYCASHPEVKYILGYNEPNFTAQANMTPAQAAETWPRLVALARELGLQIVAPALNYSPNAPYQDPLKWMDEFVAIVGLDSFDYTAVHCYGGAGVLKTLATNFHNKYGKEVWVTEFCYWPEEGNPNMQIPQETQISSMMETVEWLEQTEWIHRYAWFKAIGQYNPDGTQKGPRYGLLERQPNGVTDHSNLSEQGYVYVYMSDFDKSIYYSADQEISSSKYVDSQHLLLGKSNYDQNLCPIEITKFATGATADYQFDVPAAGQYTLALKASGQGEPVRFDPSIGVQKVAGETVTTLCEAKLMQLPGNDTEYVSLTFPLTLEAGKQTLRIYDGRPSQPSGIRIASLKLASGSGVGQIGVEKVENQDVYNLQGVKVLNAGEDIKRLPKGIYIVGGKKVRI